MAREIDRRPPWAGRDRYGLTDVEQARLLRAAARLGIAVHSHSPEALADLKRIVDAYNGLPGDPPPR